jgi:hypothetical protein
MVQVIPVMPTKCAALRDVVADVMQTIAGPESLRQISVEKASTVRRHTAIEEEGARGSEIDVVPVVVLDLEAASGSIQMKAIPVQAQSVRNQCWRSVRQVQDGSRRVKQLEGRRKGPPHSTEREVSSANRTTYSSP